MRPPWLSGLDVPNATTLSPFPTLRMKKDMVLSADRVDEVKKFFVLFCPPPPKKCVDLIQLTSCLRQPVRVHKYVSVL